MTDDPIDFKAAKRRRVEAEMDADEARWEDVCEQLVQVLTQSEQCDIGIISATLRALIDVLGEDKTETFKNGTQRHVKGMSLHDAVMHIAQRLRIMPHVGK